MNISLIGFMGTGKTTVGKKLAEELDYQFVDLDKEIVKEEGRKIPTIFAQDGEEYFRDVETKVTKKIGLRDQQVISTGGGVVLRNQNIANLKQNGILILLKATPQEIYQRTKDDNNRPLLEVEDPLTKIEALLTARRGDYQCTPYQIDTTDLSIAEVVEEALNIVDREKKK
ncbi:MAG: shikimate kinase [Bacillota bacterium]